MKYSGIGGQAVIEGIMMRNGSKYAVAVRKPDGNIAMDVKETHSWSERHPWMKWPFIRGTFSFIESMITGIKTLMFSASFYETEDGEKETPESGKEAAEDTEKASGEEGISKGVLAGTLLVSLAFAIGLFSLLPVLLASILRKWTDSGFVIALAEGVLRILIFVGYIWAVSMMKDIKRTFMYHGSEHKCINCIEHGLELNVENVRKSSKQHKRCGTSFMLIVMIISVFVFMFIRVDNVLLRMLTRVLLIPVVAGLSFEFLRFAGTHDGPMINALSRPGLWLQNLTTREPEDDMIEVAITAVEAVFDWREFQEKNCGELDRPCDGCPDLTL